MAINIARLGVVLGIDTAEFSKGIDSAKKKLGDIGEFATKAGAVAAAAFTAMTYKAMQFADEMSDLSDATGVGIAKIVQMSQALQQSGGHADDTGKILLKFAQSVDQAANGSQAMQDAFARAGVTLQDLASLSLEQLFNKTSAGIANMGDKVSQTGTKLEIFSKGMRSVDMNTFNNQMAQGTEEFTKYENAIRIAAELNDKLAQKASMTSLVFTEKVLPAVNALFDAINVKGGFAEKVFEGLANVIYGMAGALQYANHAIEAMGVAWNYIKGNITFEEFSRAQMNIENNFKLALEKIREYRREIETVKKDEKSLVPVKRKIEDSPEAKKQKEMLRVAELLSVEYNRQQVYSLQQLAIKNQMVGMTEDERRIQEAINQVTTETSRKIDEITKKREDAAGRGADAKTLAEYDKQIAKIYEMEEIFIDMARNVEASSIASQRTFEFGWDKAFNQFKENAYNYAMFAEQMFRSLTDNMLGAIDRFVDTGKFRFSDFAASVIKDLLKIQLRMQAMQLFSSIGGFGGIMNSMFRGGIEAQPGFVGPPAALMTAADGGMIDGPTLVGENGPELFIPQRSGTVIPNQQLSSALQSQPQVVYNGPYINQMSAIDTQSAFQFLAKNKEAVWSANQSASRSLPATRT